MVVFFSISLVILPPRSRCERQRRDVEQQHVLDLAGQHRTLNRRTDGDRLIRVDVLARLAPEQVLDHFLHFRHARLAADQNHFLDFGRAQSGIL